MRRFYAYMKARMAERSTWAGIAAAATAAAAFNVQWAPPIIFIAGSIAVFIPSPKREHDGC